MPYQLVLGRWSEEVTWAWTPVGTWRCFAAASSGRKRRRGAWCGRPVLCVGAPAVVARFASLSGRASCGPACGWGASLRFPGRASPFAAGASDEEGHRLHPAAGHLPTGAGAVSDRLGGFGCLPWASGWPGVGGRRAGLVRPRAARRCAWCGGLPEERGPLLRRLGDLAVVGLVLKCEACSVLGSLGHY